MFVTLAVFHLEMSQSVPPVNKKAANIFWLEKSWHMFATRPVSHAARRFPENQNSPPLLASDVEVTLSDLRHAAANERPAHLVDVLFRRTGLAWRTPVDDDGARRAAETIADILGWDEARIADEVALYGEYVRRFHLQT